MSILRLAVGDIVRDKENRRGEVVGFKRDFVLVHWDGYEAAEHCTDDELMRRGVVKASPFDVEDTVP